MDENRSQGNILPFPVSRFVYYGDFRFYYGYGNTPPDDYLENISAEMVAEPKILILGCGDIRSCLYTLWKNFSSVNSKRFNGVHFTLNDNSAAVLARNILFLHLCLKTPKEKQQKKEWLCAVWAIWFCHELLPRHKEVLNSALSVLIKFASSIKSWLSRDNPLHSLVKFTSLQVLSEINEMWKMWYGKKVSGVNSVQDMNSARLAEQSQRFQSVQITDLEQVAFGLVTNATGITSPDMPDKTMVKETTSYIKNGSVFAEEIMNRSDIVSKTTVNYTLFEREDGCYTLHYGSVPYKCFYHSFQYSEKQLRKIKAHKQCSDYLLVPDSCFEAHPFLANSMQQFCLWLQFCSEALSQVDGPIVSFTLHCSDAIEFCEMLQSPLYTKDLDAVDEFDLIYTSNLFDHLAPPNIILSALPLVKPSGHLFTLTLLYKSVSPTAEEYIQACFGVESKLLPILFGIRCINHEGSNYSSTVSAQPIPVEMVNVASSSSYQCSKLLVWEKVNAHPQKFPTLVHHSIITTALLQSVGVCATPILACMGGCTTLNHLCLETAVKALQTYAGTLDADVFSYQFWSPLCDRLVQEVMIKPFLHALQTLCILHNLHLHLTVSERTCPMCQGTPLSEYVYCCSLSVKLPFDPGLKSTSAVFTPSFMVFVHKSNCELGQQLHVQVASGIPDVHIFDNITGDVVEGNSLTLKFYCPKTLLRNTSYNVTLVSYSVVGIFGKQMNIPVTVCHQRLADCYSTPTISHTFHKTTSTPPMAASQLGSVCSHSGDGDNFETVLHLSGDCNLAMAAGSKFSTEKLSSSKIKILCGKKFQHEIQYPYPVEYNRLAVKISRQKQNVTVLASRAVYNFEEESSLFLVDPVNRLSLPPIQVSPNAYTTACGFQFTKQDCEIMERCHGEKALMPPIVCLKQTMNTLFQCRDRIFFHITVPGSYQHYRGFIAVQNYLYDIQHKTPAIDLAFCFMEGSEPFLRLMSSWDMLSSANSRGIPITEGEYELLTRVLTHFAKRTVHELSDSKHEGTYKCLREEKIDRYFTCAVVYPLYSDPDQYVREFDLTKPFTDKGKITADLDQSQKSSATKQSSEASCSCCGSVSSVLKKCGSCGLVQYCSRECQMKHWKAHKPHCSFKPKEAVTQLKKGGESKEKVLDESSSALQTPFPIARYVYNGDRLFYYGYGNTPADDYLENPSESAEPRILLLGCGDIHSCFYTLWKNFDSSNKANQYNGVHFVLNDRSAAVLARNILFLYLCLKTPKEREKAKEWLCAVWAIWFCHELLPKHDKILNSALNSLIQFARDFKTWSAQDNPLHSLVKFTSVQVLTEISQLWRMWYNKDVHGVKSVGDVNTARKAEQIRTGIKENIDSTAMFMVTTFTGTIRGSELPMGLCNIMASEVLSYYDTGSAIVESTLLEPTEPKGTVVNYTLYERQDGIYTLHYGSVPYKCFHHSFKFTPKQLEEIKVPKPLLDLLIMKDSFFETHLLLANSVQQLALWFQSCAKVLNQDNPPNITFTLHHSDAIEFCQVLQSTRHLQTLQIEQSQFDLIYTSNLIDYLNPANLVLSALPLLKPSGYLFTLTLVYKGIGSTAEEYIKACFGFESKLLPILFGIRCINHEGEMYSSAVSLQQVSWEIGNVGLVEQWPKLLIWEKVNMDPQKVPALVSDSGITTALCNSVQLCTSSLICPVQSHGYIDTMNSLGIETVVKILQSLVNVLDANVSRHQFWSPLCQLILQENKFKPFLHSLQTQCLLHGLHAHLTFTDATCPICNSVPCDESLRQISLKISLPIESQLSPHFVAFLHKSDLRDDSYCLLVTSQALEGKDVHIFDSFAGVKKGNNLTLTFYCPRSFVDDQYNVTLVSYMIKRMHGARHEFNAPHLLYRKNLSNCLISNGISHYFEQTRETPRQVDSRLCSVSSHIGDGDNFETVLQLKDAAFSKFASGIQITTKKISTAKIEILCGRLSHQLCYPHPVEYNRLSVKISRKQKTITILAARGAYNFEEENAFFQINPTNTITLPPIFVGQTAIMKYSSMQFTEKDQEILKNCCREPSLMPPMVNLKETIDTLFKCSHEHFFHIVLPVGGVHAMIIVQNHVFDYQNKTPAIDLAFCFLEFSFGNKVCNAWKRLVTTPIVRDIRVNNAEYELLQKVFGYFAKRTKCQQIAHGTKGHLQLLVKHGISQHFTRAVIYPLYADPDSIKLTAKDVLNSGFEQSSQPSGFTMASAVPHDNQTCGYCGVQSEGLKKCGKCSIVHYCSKECQTKHWKVHKRTCKPTSSESTRDKNGSNHNIVEAAPLEKCSNCSIQRSDLKKCANCGQVRYCSRDCQKKHWKEHKPNCHKSTK